MSGAFSLGNAMPYIAVISTAIGAASTLFAIIDRVPDIDPYSNAGIKPEKIGGDIEFKDVTFSYPARSGVQVKEQYFYSFIQCAKH
jgi:ATP-binding cassette subfamily B (MDR/TAP) protein 1